MWGMRSFPSDAEVVADADAVPSMLSTMLSVGGPAGVFGKGGRG